MKLKLLLLPGMILLILKLVAQCPAGDNIYPDYEKAVFDVAYSWGPVWLNAGSAVFEARRTIHQATEALHLKASGRTLATYDWFFKVRDYYESFVRVDGFRPIGFSRNIYEDGNTLVNTLTFNANSPFVISNTKRGKNPVITDTLYPGSCAFDMLTSVYYFRTLDIASFPVGEQIPVTVIIDDSVFNIYVRYLGREKYVAPDGKQYDCLKCATRMVNGTIFKGGEDVMVLVTDDRRKIPVFVEAKILIGTAKAYLKEYITKETATKKP